MERKTRKKKKGKERVKINQDEREQIREEERRKILKELRKEKHASYSSHSSCKSLSEWKQQGKPFAKRGWPTPYQDTP